MNSITNDFSEQCTSKLFCKLVDNIISCYWNKSISCRTSGLEMTAVWSWLQFFHLTLYLILWLFDYLIIWLFDYLIIWLFDANCEYWIMKFSDFKSVNRKTVLLSDACRVCSPHLFDYVIILLFDFFDTWLLNYSITWLLDYFIIWLFDCLII